MISNKNAFFDFLIGWALKPKSRICTSIPQLQFLKVQLAFLFVDEVKS